MAARLSLNEINRQRELMNYDYTHLYNIVRHGAVRKGLLPITRRINEERAGADPAEYGVVIEVDGKPRIWKFRSFEKCVEESEIRGGMVVRLGRGGGRSFDSLTIRAITDESGNLEFIEEEFTGDASVNEFISHELIEMGWPKAIYLEGTRPTSKDLLALHKRFPDVSIEEFAAAVLKHCEQPTSKDSERSGHHQTGKFLSYEEKESWYSTPAGKAWVKENPVPAIMQHTKEELFKWKTAQDEK